ncbi:MAG: hypothetical protein JRI58_13085 [Deltaproteobacteria bacterium]|nr:hypothetical protein [Deltaproteobacteria bacterium]
MTYISQARFSRKQTTTGKGMSKYQSISGRRSAIIEDVSVECLAIVQREVREARLAIQSGEATSIAYILQGEEDITFCLCDKALDKKSISVEEAVREAGHHTRLLPRHRESEFRACIKEGKVLRIQLKNLI